VRPLSAVDVFGRATGIGVLTGAALGAAIGTCVLPLIGTLIGTCVGLFFGLPFGLVNGFALAAVSRRQPGAAAATVTGALVSGALAVVAWTLLWSVNELTVPAAVFFAVLGAMQAPRAVTRPRVGAG